jgi:hypothetical protein
MPGYQKATSQNLFALGRQWGTAMVRVGNKLTLSPQDKAAIDKSLMEICGFTVYTVWQANDPFIRAVGKRGKAYKTIMQTCASKSDGGADEARSFVLWHAGQATFDSLSESMRDLAVITHVAEVGRGYTIQALRDLILFLAEVANGEATWSNLKNRYPAALTAKEDSDFDDDE